MIAPMHTPDTTSDTPTLYGIANCTTVKKARAWLTEHGVAHQFHDFKKLGVPPALPAWQAAVGWEKLLNRQGTTWRKLDAATQALAENDATVPALLQAQPSVIKRPVVHWAHGPLTVGFDATRWAELLGAAQA